MVDLWAKYFQLKWQSVPGGMGTKRMTSTGAASISPRKHSIFPRVFGLESCRKWQRTFFYVKNSGAQELVNSFYNLARRDQTPVDRTIDENSGVLDR